MIGDTLDRGGIGAATLQSQTMTVVLPNGYLTILQAADVLLPTILRKQGKDVWDRQARDEAIAEIWKAVDGGRLRAMAIGGRPRRIVRLNPAMTKSIPTLRSPRGRGFTWLRQPNPAYQQLATWFGPLVHSVSLAFRETEIQKLARRLTRAQRIAQRSDGQKSSRGRPGRITLAQPVISDLIAKSPTQNFVKDCRAFAA
jgi:hypothetical protein